MINLNNMNIMKLRTFIRYFLIITLSTFPLISKAEEGLESKYGIIVTPFTGYRYDIYQWSIPYGTSSTNQTASELTWKNHISETGLKIETKPEENQFNFQGQFKYGHLLSNSKNQDSDWDNIGEYSRTFSSVKGNIFDLSGSIGFSQKLSNSLVTYYLGMDYTKYLMKDYGLNFKINRFPNTNISNILGQAYPKSRLVTKYKFDNYAPWIGASIDYSVNDKLSIVPTVKLYLFYLSGRANWVLRTDLGHNPSFTHKALGIGASFDTEILYQYSKNLALKASVGIKNLDMQQGRKKTFFVDGTNSSSDLKKLSLLSSSVSAGIRYKL